MGKRLMIFLDDLNMPRMDQYGTQQPIALLKLLIDRKVGFTSCSASCSASCSQAAQHACLSHISQLHHLQ